MLHETRDEIDGKYMTLTKAPVTSTSPRPGSGHRNPALWDWQQGQD